MDKNLKPIRVETMDVKSLHFQSVACPRMRTLVLQTLDFQSIVVDVRGDDGDRHPLIRVRYSTLPSSWQRPRYKNLGCRRWQREASHRRTDRNRLPVSSRSPVLGDVLN